MPSGENLVTENSQDGGSDASKSASCDSDVLDYLETPLNACSLESFCHPINPENSEGQPAIPLCLGCYQLNESTGKREGRLEIYASTIESFGTAVHPPLTILGDEDGAPGILDGKWSDRLMSSYNINDFQNYYATAHANGEIWIHKVTNKTGDIAHDSKEESTNPFRATPAGKSVSPSENEGLCLALAWENMLYQNGDDNNSTTFDTRIISSYSDGHTAIHRVTENASTSVENCTQTLEFTLEHHWDSHKMFTCPAEVWCANFIDSNTVVTGGDEGSWKVWDLRQPLIKPVYHAKDDFDAGVTVLSPHPRRENLLAIGSYDETIALFDLRRMTTASNSTNKRPETLYHSDSLGGGIWRCKWHPFEDNRLLVAAMHGGCVLGQFDGLGSPGTNDQENDMSTRISFNIQKQFTLHKSMAYGIDWLAYPGAKTESDNIASKGVEAAASCSFYDNAMYLWKTDSINA
mmetsp:Transcript_9442/g.20434  ORF Transcript_9442/g.20434 Transcript_9442/m.20434 type:complete len:463 (+) Transcript_9442:125-1513(+)